MVIQGEEYVVFFILLILPIIVPATILRPPSSPWITIPPCTYEHCVEVDFSQVPPTVTIPSTAFGFSERFFIEATNGGEDGTDSCAKPDAGTTRCLFDPRNVNIINSTLQLLVPGGQKAGANEIIYTSQVTFIGSQYITSGYFEVVAQTSEVPGTCHGIFTQANPGYPIQKDEQDIEILTGHYTTANKNIPAGLEFTNWAAFPVDNSTDAREVNKVVEYGFEPTVGFHKYSIEWDNIITTYSWGNQSVVFNKFSSQNPSKFVINNWSNASSGWTEGPPKKDNILRIRSIKAYYNTKKP